MSLNKSNTSCYISTSQTETIGSRWRHTSYLPKRRIPRPKLQRQLTADSAEQSTSKSEHELERRNSLESFGSSESDDTDLEIDGVGNNQCVKRTFDPTGKRFYDLACKKYEVIPSTRFSRQLSREYLNMSKACVGEKDIQVMAYAISANTIITDLNLSENCIGSKGTRALCEALKENVFIKTLKLSYNDLGTEGARAICDLFQDSCQIREVDLSGNRFKGLDAEFFVQALKENYMLRKLNLSHNQFCEIGGEKLAEALANNDSLEEVDLSWNHLRLRGARAIGSALKNNQSIKILDVSWNGISNDGAFYFASSLKVNTTLQILDLTCNRITIEGTAFLFASLKVNETLKVLRMGLNPVTSAGVTKLLDAIKRNPNSAISSLGFSDTPITFSVGAMIAEIQQQKPAFEVVHGGYVSSDDALAKRYAQKYEVNPFFLLMSYVRAQGYRLIDMFKQFDTNQDWNLSRSEFVNGLQVAKIPLTQSQLDTLLKRLDKDDSGSIDLSELIKGEQEFRMKQRKHMKANQNMKTKEFSTSLGTPTPNQAANVRAGVLPDIHQRFSIQTLRRPQSPVVNRSRSTPASPRLSPSLRPKTPDTEMAGNVLDLVISTTEDNQIKIEGRPRSAISEKRIPISAVPQCKTGFTVTPPPEEWTPPTSPTNKETGHGLLDVVLSAMSKNHNVKGQTKLAG